MKDGWHFPLINPQQKFDIKHFIDHVGLEVKEFHDAKTDDEKDKEAVDVLHAAETFVRKYFEANGRSYESVRDAIIAKNKNRGYYDY